MKKVMAVMCMATALVACGTSSKIASVDSLNGEWSIVKINGEEVKIGEDMTAPFIGFDTTKSHVYGSTSCNRLTGALNADAKTGTIDFSALGSTRMMCHDMATEDKLMGALGKVKTFKIEKNGTLLLNGQTGNAVVELKQKAK